SVSASFVRPVAPPFRARPQPVRSASSRSGRSELRVYAAEGRRMPGSKSGATSSLFEKSCLPRYPRTRKMIHQASDLDRSEFRRAKGKTHEEIREEIDDGPGMFGYKRRGHGERR